MPKAVRPHRYEITVSVDLAGGRFSGRVDVDLDVLEETSELTCSAAGLDVSGATLSGGSTGAIGLDVRLDADAEQVAFGCETRIRPGRYRLACAFAGAVGEELRGFYRVGDVGCTQFCPNDARRVFPCWDEPEYKAVFAVALEVEDSCVAVSNSPELRRVPLPGGRVRVEFGDTMSMSTYLVAWAVGRLEITGPVFAGRTPVRVVAVPGKAALASYALEVAAHALEWYEQYFGIAYPGEKLDLVAVPEFAFGAMENLGCVTFREDLLLCEPAEISVHELAEVTETIEHEIAHMWFGDLVTMRWWNGLWLNEAFATFMSLLCFQAFRPELAPWDRFGSLRQLALGIDGLHTTRAIECPVAEPDDAFGMLDTLTYFKGASVIRMLEQHLGEERFRDGVRRYLRTHEHGSTETDDLWDALETVSGEPVRAAMDGWIRQGGSPLITASLDSGDLLLTSGPFAFMPEDGRPSAIGSGWQVPVSVEMAGATKRLMITSAPFRLRLETPHPVVNAGGSGTFHVRYEGELFARATAHLADLRPIERANLVADTWACVLAGIAPLEDFMAVTARIGETGESDPDVWSAVIEAVGLLDFVASASASASSATPALAAFVRRLAGPALARVGWEPAPGESFAANRLRGLLIEVLGTVGDDAAVQERARAVFRVAVDEGRRLPVSAAVGILPVVVRTGSRDDFEAVRARYRRPADPQDAQRHLTALAAAADRDLVSEVLAMSLAEVPSADAPRLLLALLENRYAGVAVWRFVVEHWDEMLGRYPRLSFVMMLSGVARLLQVDSGGSLATAAQALQFVKAHPMHESQRLVDQSLEQLTIHVRLVETYRDSAAMSSALAAS